MYEYVVLGNSLVGNLICVTLKNGNTLLLDYARRSSILYGYDAVLRGKSCCIDSIPILLNDDDVAEISNLISNNLRIIKTNVDVELIGTEEGYTNKIKGEFIPQVNWFDEIVNGRLFIDNGFCRVFRYLDSKCSNKFFGEIRRVELTNKKVRILDRDVTYDKLIVTYPLDFMLRKIKGIPISIKDSLSKLNFESILSTLIVVKSKLCANDGIKIVKVGKKGFLTTLITLIGSDFYSSLSKLLGREYTIVYALSPTSVNKLRGELDRLVLNELRRLINLQINDIILYRQIFIKYGLIGTVNYDDMKNLEEYFKSYDAYLIGRTAKWRDMRLSEIIREVRNFISQLS